MSAARMLSKQVLEYLNSFVNRMKGFYEIYRSETIVYRSRITSIEIVDKSPKLRVLINHQTVGSRIVQQSLATTLNTNSAFYHFHPEHARMIVALGTLEELYPQLNIAGRATFFEIAKKCQNRIIESLH